MGLREQLNDDLKDALRAHDATRTNAIRLLKAAIAQVEYTRTDPKNPDFNKPVTENDLLRVVEQQIKQRREAIDLYTKDSAPNSPRKNKPRLRRWKNICPRK